MRKWIFAALLLHISSLRASDLTQDFYNEFWKITNIGLNIKTAGSFDDFQKIIKEIVLEARTGFGTKTSESSDTDNQDPYEQIIAAFTNCSKGSCTDGSSSFGELLNIKKQLIQVEQCYANLPAPDSSNGAQTNASNVGLLVYGMNRNQTELERDTGLECSLAQATSLIRSINSNNDFNITLNDSKETKDIQAALRNVHDLLIQKYEKQEQVFIETINAKSKPNTDALIDQTTIDPKKGQKLLQALNDVITIDNFLPETSPFLNESKMDKVINYKDEYVLPSKIKDDDKVTSTDDESLKSNRAALKNSMDALQEQQSELIKSFGTLKQNALLNIDNIIKERLTVNKEKSELAALKAEIDKTFQQSDNLDTPSKLLLDIRNAMNLSNKLNYMIYLAEERIQLALATNQISQLKSLADNINTKTKAINELVFKINLGSDMIDLSGAK